MKIYMVGGAVRDKLLGEYSNERDFVVVGATREEMLDLGYKQVGKGFPVFLHPKTHEEYALARTERKIGKGYTEFVCDTSKDITLEEDLKRRDFTINAIAEAEDGTLIDPYGGQKDLSARILRHVSSSFSEDPLRVLRLARFAARFSDFTIYADTMRLAKTIVESNEIEALTEERVWRELERALCTNKPVRFFNVLNECGALPILFPSLLPELAGNLSALNVSTRLTNCCQVRFASLFHSVGVSQTKMLCERIKVPKNYSELALLVAKYNNFFHDILEFDANGLLQILDKLDAIRRKDRFNKFLLSCESHSASIPSSQMKRFKFIHQVVLGVSTKSIISKMGDKIPCGLELKNEIMLERSRVLKQELLNL